MPERHSAFATYSPASPVCSTASVTIDLTDDTPEETDEPTAAAVGPSPRSSTVNGTISVVIVDVAELEPVADHHTDVAQSAGSADHNEQEDNAGIAPPTIEMAYHPDASSIATAGADAPGAAGLSVSPIPCSSTARIDGTSAALSRSLELLIAELVTTTPPSDNGPIVPVGEPDAQQPHRGLDMPELDSYGENHAATQNEMTTGLLSEYWPADPEGSNGSVPPPEQFPAPSFEDHIVYMEIAPETAHALEQTEEPGSLMDFDLSFFGQNI